MPLRSDNNSADENTLLTAIRTVALGYPSPNTALALNSSDGTYGVSQTFIQREYDMLQGGVFPAVLFSAGTQGAGKLSQHTFAGQFTAIIDYYNRYDENSSEFDDIRAAIALDLNRMRSNLESNDILAVNGTALTVSMVKYTLSPYQGILRDINNMKLVYRTLNCIFNVLDYDALS